MGNQQSNENTRIRRTRRVYVEPKIKESAELSFYECVEKKVYSSFIRFYLDNYVTYKDGNYKYIDFDNCPVFNERNEGYLENVGLKELDLNYIRNYNHTKTFGIEDYWDVIGVAEPPRVQEVVEDDANFHGTNPQWDGNILKSTLEYIGEIAEDRQRYQASVEWARSTNNSLWKPTSWDMPPPPPK